jgi:hypothetical protein
MSEIFTFSDAIIAHSLAYSKLTPKKEINYSKKRYNLHIFLLLKSFKNNIHSTFFILCFNVQSLNMKIFEQSKVLFFRKMLDNTPYNQVNSTAAFLHEELIKLPMFPRKALESDFNLFPKFTDRELLTTDMLHKYSWCQVIF